MTPATTGAKDVAMTHDADWEGPWCRYAKYIQDNGVIKAWHMGHHTYQFSENLGIKGPHKDGSFPRVRRFTIRKDGFVSVRAEAEQGELVTKPLIFAGDKLTVNYNAKLGENGSVRVEILDDKQRPIPGFTLKECDPLSKGTIDAMVTWNGGADVSSLAGKTVHLRLVLNKADLFSFRFTK